MHVPLDLTNAQYIAIFTILAMILPVLKLPLWSSIRQEIASQHTRYYLLGPLTHYQTTEF